MNPTTIITTLLLSYTLSQNKREKIFFSPFSIGFLTMLTILHRLVGLLFVLSYLASNYAHKHHYLKIPEETSLLR